MMILNWTATMRKEQRAEKQNSRKKGRNSPPLSWKEERAASRDLGFVNIEQDATRVRKTKVRKEIRERGSEISHLYTSPTSTYKFIYEIEDKFRVIEPEIVKLSGELRTGSMKFRVLDSTSVCRCLHWFLVNNCWFKNVYLQDQPVNLRTYCVCYFDKLILFL